MASLKVLLDPGRKHAGMTIVVLGHFLVWLCAQYLKVTPPNTEQPSDL